ncbi:MAG: PEGA domain-containing protein [Myxococcota bacterium]
MKLPDRAMSVVAAIFTLSLLLAVPATGFAQGTMAGLKFEAGDSMDPRVSSEVRSSVNDAFNEVDDWSFRGFRKTRKRLDPVVRDCSTPECLKKAYEATDAEAGLGIEITGEAQIYNWTITFWNLRTGEEIKTKTGTCELCGRAEVTRTFRESLKAALIGTSVPEAPQADTADTGDAGGGDSGATEDTGGKKVALRVSVVPKDAAITIDGEDAGAGDVTEAVGVGEHTVAFKLEGYQGLRETIVVDDSTEGPVLLRVHLSRTDPEAVKVSGGSTGPLDRLGAPKRNLYGAISVGTGAVLLGTGIYLTSIDGEAACDPGVPQDECPEVYATGGAGTALGVIGATAATAGVTLLIWEVLAGKSETTNDDSDGGDTPDAGDDDGAEVKFGPSLTPGGGGGFLIRGRF